jgi:hypothetical protein
MPLEAAAKYVAVEKQLAVLAREMEMSGSLLEKSRLRQDGITGLAIQDLLVTIATEMEVAVVAEREEFGARPKLHSRLPGLRRAELEAWTDAHDERLEQLRFEVEL